MHLELRDLGFKTSDVNQMTPEDAHAILSKAKEALKTDTTPSPQPTEEETPTNPQNPFSPTSLHSELDPIKSSISPQEHKNQFFSTCGFDESIDSDRYADIVSGVMKKQTLKRKQKQHDSEKESKSPI